MFIDEVEITITAGKGGNGKVSFYPLKRGPDGGDGGNGGNVYVTLNPQLSNLNKYWEKREYKAGDGQMGGSYRRQGADGEDLVLGFPPGTTLIDTKSARELAIVSEKQRTLVATGGAGGRGNNAFKSATHQVPHEFEPGAHGEEKRFRVIMRLIADYGLIGLPNAGKSSLLNELTAAQVRTAPYPFTTLEPNLGACDGKILADIPGLIEGASTGKGLGIKFLKHIEKVKMLLHCVAADSTDVLADYETVMKELAEYNPGLVEKKQILLLTKHDLVSEDEKKKKLKLLKKKNPNVIPVSIHDLDSLNELKKVLG